jgi:hypothetical protein
VVTYTQKADCLAHEPYAPIEVLPWCVAETTVGQLLERARADLGPAAVVEANQDLLAGLLCTRCGDEEPYLTSLGKVTEAQGRCPRCGEPRTPRLLRVFNGRDAALLGRTLGGIGIPPWDVLGARAGERFRYYEFQGDRETVLGALAM